jgi:hypothetical protein
MGWSYDVTRLDEPLNLIRSLVRDTDEADNLIQDEEILATLAAEGNHVYRAAAAVCDQIALDLGRELDLKGAISSSSRDKFDQYVGMADRYRQRAKGRAKPLAGGLSRAEKESRESDPDRVQPAFRRDQDELMRTPT